MHVVVNVSAFFHDAQLHAFARRMHRQCVIASGRDKINPAFAAFLIGEPQRSNHFPAFSNVGFAFLSGFYNKRGWAIRQARRAHVPDFELLILEKGIFQRFNPGGRPGALRAGRAPYGNSVPE